MLRAIVIVLAAALCACGAAPNASPAKNVTPPVRKAKAVDAIDADAPFRLGVDFAALRKSVWLDVMVMALGELTRPGTSKLLKRNCRFDPFRDVRVVEVSRDERNDALLAVEPMEPMGNELACIRSALTAHGVNVEAEVVAGLWLIGTPRAMREAKRRLQVKSVGEGNAAGSLVWIDAEDSSDPTASYSIRVRGDASKLTVLTQVDFARGDPPDEASIRQRLEALAAKIAPEVDAGEELKRSLGAATITVAPKRAIVSVELRSVPRLGELLGKVFEGWAQSGKIKQCNRLINVINDAQGPLKSASGSDPDALMKLADTLTNVAIQVSAVELKDTTLIGLRDAYAYMARDLALASRRTSEALTSNDPKLAANAARDMSSFGPRESELVDSINRYCSKPN